MDPIFTNLPYSTNIEEHVPLVSITIPTNSTHPQLLFYPCISFSIANIFHLFLTSLLIPSSSCPMFILLFDYSGGVWSGCKRNVVKNRGLSYYRGWMSHLTHTQTLPLHTALRVLESVITAGDLQFCFRDVRPPAKVTGGYRIYLPMLPHAHTAACV